MLHARISLLKSYLNSLPQSYLTTPAVSSESEDGTEAQHADTSTSAPTINHYLLRSILALLSRLPLLLPPANLSSFKQETLAEKSDVELASLLGSMGRSVKEAREMGRKFEVVDKARNLGKKSYMGMSGTGDAWGSDDRNGGGYEMMDGGYVM